MIWVDETKVVDMDDPSYSKTADMSSGYIGLYNEVASTAFDNVVVGPLRPNLEYSQLCLEDYAKLIFFSLLILGHDVT